MTRKHIVVGALLLWIVAACAGRDRPGPGGSMSSEVRPTTAASARCGPVPASSGPAATLATLRITGPSSAHSGDTVPVRGSIHISQTGPRVITRPSRSRLLIVREGRVVGETRNPQPDFDIPLVLSAGAVRPAQALPAAAAMSACGVGAGGTSQLPPGQYSIVAVLGYGQDRLNAGAEGAGGNFVLVSDPWPITVT